MSGQGWVPPVTDLMRGPFSVDWKALDGWRGELVEPVRHEGVWYVGGVVERLSHDRWRLVVRRAGFYVKDRARWEAVYGQTVPPQEWVCDPDGGLLTEWRPMLAMRVDPEQLREPGKLMTGCGKTPAGGWHCEGSGCLDAGRVCMDDAAAPDPFDGILPGDPGGLIPVAGPEHDVLSDLRGLTVSREALGLDPSAADLLSRHRRRLLDGLNDHYRREMERVFLPPSLRRPEPGADCG